MSKLTAVKRQGYFTHVRKRWKQKGVQEVDDQHPKYLFTQYIRHGVRSFLLNHDKKKMFLSKEDHEEVTRHEFTCPLHQSPIGFESYAPGVFYSLRQRIGLSSVEYLETVSPVDNQNFHYEFLTNSKSGQSFFLTRNQQFMIKTIAKSEVDFFMRILDKYIQHFESFPHSLLVKFVGMYSIQVSKFKKPVHFVVMLSIYYPGERIQYRYDIKGCKIGRFTKPAEDGSNVVVILKEQNLKDGKLFLGQQKEWFLHQIEIDTKFLQTIGVLDYSLLVGMQSLQGDEQLQNHQMASVVSRIQKSVAREHCVFKPSAHHTENINIAPLPETSSISTPNTLGTDAKCSPDSEYVSDEGSTLPGMVQDSTSVPQNPIQSRSTSSLGCPCLGRPSSAQTNGSGVTSPSMTSHTLTCTYATISSEEASRQNRRLLPNDRNELHVIDGDDQRYYLGIIDFFTRYTFKKKLANAYKRVIYPKLSFSTVHPDIFADRFRKYLEDHTA
uniref:Phosphatidylinositol 4-phosphate 5-kinase-like protein 1 n=1 Tax=Phallusia mammillata TaxID=59560 RepID=A0A6F9DN63_9ASCI|nr:phosphatidylinositol 4-phosphate 5-kinase-like protein 1 [Phallusia mammillata]